MKTSRDWNSRVNIIKAIQTPLGFFVLVVLLVEAIFGVIASFSDGSHRTYLIIGMFALILLLVLIVSAIAVFRPEALYGSRPIRGVSLPRSNAAGEETEIRHETTCVLIEGTDRISAEMSNAAKEATKYIYTIGGRSRNQVYLNAIQERVQRGDVHYIRVITGNHICHPLCEHLGQLMGVVDLGYLIEQKFGGVMVTHNTTFIGLPSSNVSVLNKALKIESEQIAADYRSYVVEVLGNSQRDIRPEHIKKLCTTCRSNSAQQKGAADGK